MTDNAYSPYWESDTRNQQIERLASSDETFDMVIVGGGITGAGIYREACARGLKVLLVEQQDFAWGTSSRSSKMVHGGLRYLAKGQFKLAKDSVQERQKLMGQLDGLVSPLPFMMAHYKGQFPGPWLFSKLLSIYDFFAGRKYRHFVSDNVQAFWLPGIRQAQLQGASGFMDAVTDDARLVMRVLNDGNRRGGIALNYVKATGLIRCGNGLSQDGAQDRVIGAYLADQETGKEFSVNASVVVNATGAWTDTLRQMLGAERQIRPLRGSHLVVPFWRLPISFSLSFFHPKDKRPVFVFPWEGQTVIGTTDLDHRGDLEQEAAISQEELDYLLTAANAQFEGVQLSRDDVMSSWSGVRPIVVDSVNESADAPAKPSDETREHMIWDEAGCISIAGGKLTTFRLLALEVLEAASAYLSLDPERLKHPTDFDPMSGSDPYSGPESELAPANKPLGSLCRQRLQGRYGPQLADVLAMTEPELNARLGDTDTRLFELVWACRHECVEHLDDLLLRRVRLGMVTAHGGIDLIEPHAERLRTELAWSAAKWQEECCRYRGIIQRYYSLPDESSEACAS